MRDHDVVARPETVIAEPFHLAGEGEKARARGRGPKDRQVAAELHPSAPPPAARFVGPALAALAAGGVDHALTELVAGDHLPEPRALDLAARRLGNGARLDEENARGPMAGAVVDALHDFPDQMPPGLRVVGALTDLGDYMQALAARALALDAHGCRVPHARHVVDDLLDVRGDQVRPAKDDEVLEPSADEEESLAVEEAQLARAQPSVGRERALRRLGILVVALHDAGTLHADLALHAGAHRPRFVHDADRDALAGRADGEELPGGVEAQRGLAGPYRDGERGLRQPVARRDEVLDAELLLECFDGAEPDRLGAGKRLLQGRQIDAGRVADVPHAVPEAEIRRDRERGLDARRQL